MWFEFSLVVSSSLGFHCQFLDLGLASEAFVGDGGLWSSLFPDLLFLEDGGRVRGLRSLVNPLFSC